MSHERELLIAGLVSTYEGAVEHHWHEAAVIAEGLGWDIDESNGDLPDADWVRIKLGDRIVVPFDPDPERGADIGPCPVCDKQVARLLLSGHLEVHRRKGEIS